MLSHHATQPSDISQSTTFRLTALLIVAGASALASGVTNKVIQARDSGMDNYGDFCMQSAQVLYGAAFVITGTLVVAQLAKGCYDVGKNTSGYLGSFFKKPTHEQNDRMGYTELQTPYHDEENPFHEPSHTLN